MASIRPEQNANLKSYSTSLSYPDKELTHLLERLTAFPAILNLEEQGRFALGFYHQKARILSQAPKTGNEASSFSVDSNNDTTDSSTSEGE